MKNLISDFFKIAILTLILSAPAYAEHDSGQGKSQDSDKLDSVSVAPEPSAFWLLLAGTLAMAVYIRRDNMRNPN